MHKDFDGLAVHFHQVVVGQNPECLDRIHEGATDGLDTHDILQCPIHRMGQVAALEEVAQQQGRAFDPAIATFLGDL